MNLMSWHRVTWAVCTSGRIEERSLQAWHIHRTLTNECFICYLHDVADEVKGKGRNQAGDIHEGDVQSAGRRMLFSYPIFRNLWSSNWNSRSAQAGFFQKDHGAQVIKLFYRTPEASIPVQLAATCACNLVVASQAPCACPDLEIHRLSFIRWVGIALPVRSSRVSRLFFIAKPSAWTRESLVHSVAGFNWRMLLN